MLFFSQAARGAFVPVEMKTSLNVTAHAMLGKDGKLRVTLINKDPSQVVVIHIQAKGHDFAKAEVLRLAAPALDATTGISLGGRSVGRDGTWSPARLESVAPAGDGFSVVLPAGSAALVIIE